MATPRVWAQSSLLIDGAKKKLRNIDARSELGYLAGKNWPTLHYKGLPSTTGCPKMEWADGDEGTNRTLEKSISVLSVVPIAQPVCLRTHCNISVASLCF